MASEWRPIEANDPYNDESPVWVDENGCVCWAGAAGEVRRLVLHGDARLCNLVEVPAAPAVPPDIAYITKKALERYRNRIEEVGTMGWYPDNTVVQQEIARIDAALEWLAAQPAAQDTQGEGDGSPR